MSDSSPKRPVMLVILDGWGLRAETEFNAVALAKTPNMDRLASLYPTSRLLTSGADVGLPLGTMGNSEVGHLNIGAGRVVWQEVMRINNSIANGSFFENPALVGAFELACKRGGRVHLFGLLSNALVHSCDEHTLALIRMARSFGLERTQLICHIFTDGRDMPPRSALAPLQQLERAMALYDCGVVASVCGRYYAMDRDRRWNRVKLAYDLLVSGRAEFRVASAREALQQAYRRAGQHPPEADYPAETDEFIRPTVILDESGKPRATIQDGDVVISFNHRSDRPREIIRALSDEDFERHTKNDPVPGFARHSRVQVHLVTMTDYRAGFDCPVAFESNPLQDTLGEVVSQAGIQQFHTAETEKYPHVTFFVNGGREEPYPGETRFMADSPRVDTYDLQPEMSAEQVTNQAVEAILSENYRFLLLNYANGDMVGHTGILEAAINAVETVDENVGRLVEAIEKVGGELLITADHGNCEQMWDEESNGPHTAHTTNPVPCILMSERHRHRRLQNGRLADLAPTLLQLLGLDPPEAMTGSVLISGDANG